ncbi:class I adenylate-forming enzyme family protein [Streptomyces sp. AM 4-1-1]|uniref:class I adenylate-forming enzyme family protein n=1 Tax=Streptomyces sp. AM 4-1-1 TaxID=3028710 RepID=UPI0023B890B9|nr:class I adenylate-forming enzyme family protein [Streptomyces sp. AM 4-1-1]WEH32310.1 class I adenylate-forming enzyme family protein [Streptomyces sp. AM 4-1-1]
MPIGSVCADGAWVDDVLLGGDGRDIVLHLGEPVDRSELRRLVVEQQGRLVAAGLTPSGTVAVRLPPSLACIVSMLAGWRAGAQVTLLDYRLTTHEIGKAIARLAPQLVVEPVGEVTGTLRGFFDVHTRVTPLRGGRPARSAHVLLQLSSGSTGPSKVIGRTLDSLLAEIERYGRLDGFPRKGERTVVLASIIHVLGLVGGLLYGLAAGSQVILPARHTVDGILKAVAAGEEPTTVLGVPSQAAVLAAARNPPVLPQFHRMITGGELVKADVRERFTRGYGAELGVMYGMTEVGVIATDLTGADRPGLTPAPGVRVRVEDGEILVGLPESPYVGQTDPARFVDGWLRTKDAGSLDDAGRLTVHGRLDSQVSVGGLKVDLAEIEAFITGLPGITDAVVLHDSGIEAFVAVRERTVFDGLAACLAARLAPYKRPRTLHLMAEIPRTATGKPVRDVAALRAAVRPAAGV